MRPRDKPRMNDLLYTAFKLGNGVFEAYGSPLGMAFRGRPFSVPQSAGLLWILKYVMLSWMGCILLYLMCGDSKIRYAELYELYFTLSAV